MRERTCTGLALMASYWAEPDPPDAAAEPDHADTAAEAYSRCSHPTYVDPRRRQPHYTRTR